jgi:putative ABC transport system permease protein
VNGTSNNSKRPRFATLSSEVRESFVMATTAIASHKLRSCLTLLGVIVGVFSIIVVMTTMRAMQKKIEADMDVLGGHTFVIQKWPGVYFGGREGMEKYWRRKDLTVAQGMELRKRATLAGNIGLELSTTATDATSRDAKGPPNVHINGDTPGSFPAQNWIVEEGRGLTDSDVDGARDICVLGNSLSKDLFPMGSALDQKIKLNGISYTVVGVLESKGTMQNGNQDNFAIIPITTFQNRYGGRRQSVGMFVQATSQEMYEETVEQVRGILRMLRKVEPGAEDDFEIVSNDSMLEQINKFTLAVRVGVSVVSSIALIAAGIGIMNIMLVSVTERTREIGIRRAIGAKKRNIMTQFIMEAVVLCQFGGLIGVAVGVGAGNWAAHLLEMPAVIPIDWVILGLVICSIVGVVFGTYPAYKAANLDPIESLRYE